MVFRITVMIVLVSTLAACGDDDDGGTNDEVPGMVQLQEEVFEPGCTHDACHAGEQGIAGLGFGDAESAYEQLVGADPINVEVAKLAAA